MQKVYIFGAGNNAFGVIKFYGKENIIAAIDNEPQKRGSQVIGIPVISLEDYMENNNGERIVITTGMFGDIVKQLKRNNITNYVLAPFIIMGMVEVEQIVTEWDLENKKQIYILGYNIIVEKLHSYVKKKNIMTQFLIATDINSEIRALQKDGLHRIEYDEIPSNEEIYVFKEKLTQQDNIVIANHVSNDIYELQTRKSKESERCIKKLKDCHKGERCFIVGNGPSLKTEDIDNIYDLGVASFGFNLIYKLFSSVKWRPTYYVLADYMLYKTYYDEIEKINVDQMFIRNFYNMDALPYIDNAIYYRGYARRGYYEDQKYSKDVSKVVYSGCSVMFDAIQIACYMGYKKIYIIGADFSNIGDAASKGNHVYDGVYKDKRVVAGRSYWDAVSTALQKCKEYALENDIEIYNATRGGFLEVFERKDLDEVLKEIEDEKM